MSSDIARLCDETADIVFFPVRHHSPAASRLLHEWITAQRPAAVLIEGPSDFNDRIEELLLDHDLPIAIYSYVRGETGEGMPVHSGAYYPFCEYSPEWVAVQAGHEVGASVRFIDLPWSRTASDDTATHRYADAELRRSGYVRALCDRLQVEDFDDLWDRIIESQLSLALSDYLHRVHSLCTSIRASDQGEPDQHAADQHASDQHASDGRESEAPKYETGVPPGDVAREQFMASEVAAARRTTEGQILVVTGGYHSSAIWSYLEAESTTSGDASSGDASSGEASSGDDPASTADDRSQSSGDVGIALTTYSFEQLDSLTGYNAGMPSPGFYQFAWEQSASGVFDHRPILRSVVGSLRPC